MGTRPLLQGRVGSVRPQQQEPEQQEQQQRVSVGGGPRLSGPHQKWTAPSLSPSRGSHERWRDPVLAVDMSLRQGQRAYIVEARPLCLQYGAWVGPFISPADSFLPSPQEPTYLCHHPADMLKLPITQEFHLMAEQHRTTDVPSPNRGVSTPRCGSTRKQPHEGVFSPRLSEGTSIHTQPRSISISESSPRT